MDHPGKRSYERVSFSVDLEVLNLSTGQTCRGRSIDLSRGGMAFFAERFIAKGTRIRIRFWIKDNGRPVVIQVAASVQRAQTESDGGIMGAEFDAPLDPQSHPLPCEIVDGRS
jgi:c-di-GMP-binding flagellar brake protein YcgR